MFCTSEMGTLATPTSTPLTSSSASAQTVKLVFISGQGAIAISSGNALTDPFDDLVGLQMVREPIVEDRHPRRGVVRAGEDRPRPLERRGLVEVDPVHE